MKVNLFFVFAGVAFLFCIIFVAIGGFWYFDAKNNIEHNQKVIDSFEKEDGENHLLYQKGEESGVHHENYTSAQKKQEEAEEDQDMTPIWFVFAAILVLVAITLVVVHFILEKRAGDKMAASFFVDSPPASDERPDK